MQIATIHFANFPLQPFSFFAYLFTLGLFVCSIQIDILVDYHFTVITVNSTLTDEQIYC